MSKKKLSLMRKVMISVIFVIVGLLAGYFYYKYFGCKTGCAITSNPVLTMLYTGFMGYLISTFFPS